MGVAAVGQGRRPVVVVGVNPAVFLAAFFADCTVGTGGRAAGVPGAYDRDIVVNVATAFLYFSEPNWPIRHFGRRAG